MTKIHARPFIRTIRRVVIAGSVVCLFGCAALPPVAEHTESPTPTVSTAQPVNAPPGYWVRETIMLH